MSAPGRHIAGVSVAGIGSVWRGQVAADLVLARKALVAAVADLSVAQLAAAGANAELLEMNAMLERSQNPAALSSALTARHRQHAKLLQQAGPVNLRRARETLSVTQIIVADLELSLTQLDEMNPVAMAEAIA